MPRHCQPFDVVHIAHTSFPDDQRPRREALLAAEGGKRVAVIAARYGLDPRPVSRYGPLAVIRLPGERRRGAFGKYVMEYTGFLVRAWLLMRRDSRFRSARVVHVHSLPDFLVAAAGPARRQGARVILDLHEIFPEFMRTKFPGLLGRLAEPLVRLAERWSRRQADVVLTVNRETHALLHARSSHATERLVIVHNAPAIDDFGPAREPAGAVHSPARLAYHGTLTYLYGLDLAVTALAMARSSGIRATLAIFGDGPERPHLERLVSELGLTSEVTLRGAVSHRVLRDELPTFDAGFLPTRLDGMTRYSLSTKLLEYVHLGIPLMTARLPSYLRYFPEGAAWYFAPDDPASAAASIIAFVTAPNHERRTRALLAQRSSADIAWPIEAARLRAVYDELLDPLRRAPS